MDRLNYPIDYELGLVVPSLAKILANCLAYWKLPGKMLFISAEAFQFCVVSEANLWFILV